METIRKQVLLHQIEMTKDTNSRGHYGDIEQLSKRIKSFGLQGAVRLREIEGENGQTKYAVEDGHRRLEALTNLVSQGTGNSDSGESLEVIWAEIIPQGMGEEDRLMTQLALNTSQESWSAFDQARHIEKMLLNGVSLEQIKDKMGLGDQAIQQRMSLLKAPAEVQDALQNNDISFSAARAILSIPNEDLQKELVEEAKQKDLTSRAVETRASELTDKAVNELGAKTARKRKSPATRIAKIVMRPLADIITRIESRQADLAVMKDETEKARVAGYIEGLQYSLVDKNVLAEERKANKTKAKGKK